MLFCRRRFALPTVVLAAALMGSLLTLPSAAADSTTESQFLSSTNSARSQHGLPRYTTSSDLTTIARRWAAHMAANRTLAHNPNLASEVCCWRSVGENVGEGGSESDIQQAFMGSSSHRANILSTTFTQIGIGTARSSDGTLWVDEVFRAPSSSAAPRTAVRQSTTTTRPVATRASRSAYRPALPVARPRAVRRAVPAVLPPLSSAFLRQVRQHLAPGVRADPVAAAFGYAEVMWAFDRRLAGLNHRR